MRDLPDGATVTAAPDHLSTDVADEEVVLDVESGTYHGLNPVAADIWRAVQTPRTVDQLVDHVDAEYDADRERIRADVEAFVDRLVELGLVVVDDASR